jgi:hypothetical protein
MARTRVLVAAVLAAVLFLTPALVALADGIRGG